MIPRKVPVLETIATLSLVAISISVVAVLVPKTDFGDAATWAGALGAFLAFLAAIWLANSQERQRSQTAKDIAQLAACRVSSQVANIYVTAGSLLAHLAFVNDGRLDTRAAKRLKTLLNEPGQTIGNTETLVQLVPLPNRAAHRIARATGLLQGVVWEISEFVDDISWERITEGDRQEYRRAWQGDVSQAVELLSCAQDEVLAAADMGAPHPSQEDLYGLPTDEDMY